jgi:hypothetical protein
MRSVNVGEVCNLAGGRAKEAGWRGASLGWSTRPECDFRRLAGNTDWAVSHSQIQPFSRGNERRSVFATSRHEPHFSGVLHPKTRRLAVLAREVANLAYFAAASGVKYSM